MQTTLTSSANGNGNGACRTNGSARGPLRAALQHRWRFLHGFVRNPNVVGAIGPSSRSLAAALAEPLRKAPRPVSILEVGAGTGAITRYLGTVLTPEDEFDICEIENSFADILEHDVLTRPEFAPLMAGGRVQLLRMPVQMLPAEKKYDFIISGLPLTVFELRDVEDVFAVIRRCLKPGGVFSYFEYLGMRRTSRALALGRRRERLRAVNAFLTQNLRDHRFARKSVFLNFPPATAHYLRFDP